VPPFFILINYLLYTIWIYLSIQNIHVNMTSMYYSVGDHTFTNKFLAARHAVATGTDIHFNMYESAFDRVDWMKEPTETWDQLLDRRAQQIAAKGKPIVLNFSGGTDSYTIYKVFERNNIHIDIIYFRRRNTDLDNMFDEKKILEMLNQGVYDKTTRVIARLDDPSIFAPAYSDPDWLWHQNVKYEFGLGLAGDSATDAWLAEQLGTDDFISVVGFDKPRLAFDWHGVYSYQKDNYLTRAIGCPTLDCFYLSPELPELHVKQSYLLLNWIKGQHPGKGPHNLKHYNKIDDPTKFAWNTYALACGRFGDLAESWASHTAWQSLKLILPRNGKFYGNEHQGPGNNWFRSLIGTQTLDNFTQGWLDMSHDAAGKYLIQDPNNVYSLKTYTSKFYRMRFI